MAERVIKRIPTLKDVRDRQWRDADHWTRELFRQLYRLGFDWAGESDDGRFYLTNVGARGLTLIVRASGSGDTLKVERVACADFRKETGKGDLTARQAEKWLRKRASRGKQYLI